MRLRLIYGSIAVLALAVSASLSLAAPPSLELPKEVTGDPGAFVQVPAKTDGKHVSWKAIDAGLNLFPTELLKDTKTAVVTAARPGRYRLIAVTAAGDEVSPFAETLVVIGNAPIPPPPDPPTPPDPPSPSNTGLKEASAAGLANVKDKSRAADLAKAQRAHASAVAAGAFSSTAAVLAGWRAANNRLEPDLTQLPAFQTNWLPWGEAVSKKLASLHSAGKLPDNAAWAAAFNEVADGLEGK